MLKILLFLLRSVIVGWRSVLKMGCFLGCFRSKDDGKQKNHLFSKSSWKKRDPAMPCNRYVSVVSSEEKGTPCETELRIFQENIDDEVNVREDLRQETKFLKTCGAILETPPEIRETSVQNLVASTICRKKINWDQQFHKCSDLPLKVHETIINIEENFESCQLQEHNKSKKMAQVEENKDSGVEKGVDSAATKTSPSQTEILVPPFGCSESPYPTPLILVDGIQTPATIYPSKSENIRIGKIRTQFVFPVEDICPSSFKSKEASVNSNSVQSIFFNCRKPPIGTDEIEAAMDITKDPFCSGKSSDVDRTAIRALAAHWNEEKPSRLASKQWDGNGIPNSTTKYKEDQKVSWHATPFEVRLEKVLSDEKLYPRRFVLEAWWKNDRTRKKRIRRRYCHHLVRSNSSYHHRFSHSWLDRHE